MRRSTFTVLSHVRRIFQSAGLLDQTFEHGIGSGSKGRGFGIMLLGELEGRRLLCCIKDCQIGVGIHIPVESLSPS